MKKTLAVSISLIISSQALVSQAQVDNQFLMSEDVMRSQRAHIPLFEIPREKNVTNALNLSLQHNNDKTKPKDKTGTVVVDSRYRTEYFGSFLLGSDEQPFKVILDTGSSDIWVPEKRCNSIACLRKEAFNDEKSITFKTKKHPMHIRYGLGSMRGYVGYDSVSLGGISVCNQGFGLATQLSNNFMDSPFDGVFGLAFKANSSAAETPWLDNAVKQGAIPKAVFSFYLSNTPQGGDSRLIIGEPDPTYYQGHIHWHPLKKLAKHIPKDLFYSIDIDNISVGDQPIPLICPHDGKCPAIVDSGTSLIIGPKEEVEHILANLDLNDDCSNLSKQPPITFTIDGMKYDVPPEIYVVKQVSSLGEERCIPGLSPSKGKAWILGDAFMRAFYVIFDKTDEKVAFATLADKYNKPKDIRRLYHQPVNVAD